MHAIFLPLLMYCVWGTVTNTSLLSRVTNEMGQKQNREMRKTPVLQQMSRVMENQFTHQLKIQIKLYDWEWFWIDWSALKL